MPHPIMLSLILLVLTTSDVLADQNERAFDINFYLSLRMQAESVHPSNQQAMSSYRGLRDAYSRVGFNAEYRFDTENRLFAQLEIPYDAAKSRFRDSYDQGSVGRSNAERIRVGIVGLDSAWGTVTLGQLWMPYYNAITLPVDQFSTFYSGFATYSTFRVKETVAYQSPDIGGWQFGGSYSTRHGNIRSPSRIDDRRIQAVASYQLNDTLFAVGMDDRGNAAGFRDRIYGASLTHTIGQWDLALKYELTDTNNPASFYGNNRRAVNIFTSYQHGKNRYKLMLARVESYGETVVHAGVDHQFNEALTLFIEFYQEQETAALTGKRKGLDGFDAATRGGRIIAAGFRYDFSF
ncbi:MAG: porin [Methylophaga sp.]|nr:porin [Methylophaga sp.]